MDKLVPKKGRKRFFQPSEEEKIAFDLARIDSKVKKKEQKQIRAEKMQKEALQKKNELLQERQRFLKGLKTNPEKKTLFEPSVSKKLLV